MGRIIQQNNGKTTVFVTGEDFNNLASTANTYYVGVDLNTGSFEKKNPDGSYENFGAGSSFTGGTVSGYTEFTNALSATTISGGSFNGLNLGIGAGNEITNIGIGINALSLNNGGSNNVALGQKALYSNTTGSSNIAQ
jgi:hypothetical protein